MIMWMSSKDDEDVEKRVHCKPEQVEPAYIECGNGAAAMQVSQVNFFELGPIWLELRLNDQ